jgi:FAD/FMN-containing dehydrogenase
MIATDVVTADGTIRKATASSGDEALFWACSGAGGGNFGINTSLSFQTFAVHRLTAYDLRWSGDDLENVFQALASALEAAPAALGCRLNAGITSAAHGGSGEIVVRLLGQFDGSIADLLEILQPAYTIAPPSHVYFLEELPYWDAQDKLSEAGLPESYHESSRFYNDAIDATTVGEVFTWLRRWPATAASAAFKLFETGERVNAIAPGASAFVHRNSKWLSSIGLVWEGSTPASAVQRDLEWQSAFYDAIVPLAKGGAYQNFIDPSLRDWQDAYYGTNLPRLQSIKKRLDPKHVFKFPESIP